MAAENGYQMPASSVEYLLDVVIFSIFHIVTRDISYYDHRCAVSNAPSASAAPTAPPRARDKMDGTHICTARELMRWLTALLCFVDETYDTLEKGNCQTPKSYLYLYPYLYLYIYLCPYMYLFLYLYLHYTSIPIYNDANNAMNAKPEEAALD